MRKALIFAVAALMSLTAHAELTEQELDNFVYQPKYSSVSLSPDGKRLAANVRVGDDYNMVIMDITEPRKPKVTYQFKQINDESIVGIRWVSDKRLLYQTTDTRSIQKEEQLTGRIYAIDYNGKRGALVMGPTTGRSIFLLNNIVSRLPEEKRNILAMTSSVFGDRAQQLERINIYTGVHDVVATSPFSRGGLFTDSKGRARFASMQDESDLKVYYAYRASEDSDWVKFENPFEADVQFLDINEDGSKILMIRNDTFKTGVVELDTATMAHRVISENPKSSVRSIIWNRTNEDDVTIEGVVYEPGEPVVDFVNSDSNLVRTYKRLMASFPGHRVVLSGGREEQTKRLLTVYSDRQPPRYFLFDMEAFTAQYLFDQRPGVDADEMAPRKPYWITARDGVDFQLFVTRKEDVEGPQPTVFVIHGGPFGINDSWSFDAEAQLLASKGFTVIQPNFRGSGGRGQQFTTMGYKKWGLEMQDDITDATQWAFEQGIADPERTCIYGWSYGGYATLAAVTKEPELYTCAYAMAGVYDIPQLYRRGDTNDTRGGREFMRQAVGESREDMIARSPAYHVENIVTPLFLAHGKADIRVPIQQYTVLAKNLDEAGVEYESLLISNEAHTLYAPESRRAYYNALTDFLGQHLGPNAPGKSGQYASVE